METSLKTEKKKSELPKIWGGCSPPRPPGPYAYVLEDKCKQYSPSQISVVHLAALEKYV